MANTEPAATSRTITDPGRSGGRFGRELRPWLVLLASSGIALILTHRLWRAHPRRTPTYSGDEFVYLSQIQSVSETGWWYSQPRLGAPFGQVNHDFPFGGDSLQVLLVKLIGYVTRDAALTLNLFFWLSSILIAASMFFVLRRLRFPVAIAVAAAVLYANLSYHMAHGTVHLYRSAYYAVPLACLGLLWAAGVDGGLLDSDGRFRRRRVAFVFAVAALVAVTDTTIVVFPATLFGIVGLARMGRKRWREGTLSLAVAATIPVVLVVANAPSFVYRFQNGANDVVLKRTAREQEVFGLKISKMLFPGDRHPISLLGDFGRKTVERSPIPSEFGQYIGIVAIVGLLSLIYVLMQFVSGDRASAVRSPQMEPVAGILAIVAILLAVPGGFSFVLTVLGGEEFRVWNRISVYISAFALIGSAALLDRSWQWLSSAWPTLSARILASSALIGMVALGLVDQTAMHPFPYDRAASDFNSDRVFYASLEDGLPECGAVFNLPYNWAPEVGWDRGRTYHQAVSTVHTDCLRFSYGGISGRQSGEWQRVASTLPAAVAIDAVLLAGFDGFAVERGDYAHDSPAALEELLGSQLGDSSPIISPAADLAGFDGASRLRTLETLLTDAERAAISEAILDPLVPLFGDGFDAVPIVERALFTTTGTVELANYGEERSVQVVFDNLGLDNVESLEVRNADGDLVASFNEATYGSRVSFPLRVVDDVELVVRAAPSVANRAARVAFNVVIIDDRLAPLVLLHPGSLASLDATSPRKT